jgi:NADPH:quinone reductase-like Zn-dependent oxidoreductase
MINKAAWLTGLKARPLAIDTAPMPVPGPHEVAIRHRAVAVNPVDWAVQNVGFDMVTYPFLPGLDAAGDVVAIGSEVTEFQVGDRVVASLDPFKEAKTPNAAFQLYSATRERCVAKIPNNIAYKDAAVLPLAFLTAASALFDPKTLALPWNQPETKRNQQTVLVWGGGTRVGACAIQLLVAAGFDAAVTCGSHNFEVCKEIGAKYLFDYKSPSVVQDVVDGLKDVECAGSLCAYLDADSEKVCGQIMSKLKGKRFVSTMRVPMMPLQDDLPDGVGTSNGTLDLM